MPMEVDTPSQTITKMGLETATAADAKGRIITVNRLSALQYYRLTKAMGAAASNPATMDLALIASSVRRIDVLDIAFPASERDVEVVMQQLDFDGLTAAGEALKKLGENAEAGVEAAKN